MSEGSHRLTWTSFGFVVFALVFQRAYSFYSLLNMDYQVTLGLVSAVSWLILLVLERKIRSLVRPLTALSAVLLIAAFCLQEVFLLDMFSGNAQDQLLIASILFFSSGNALYCRLWILAYERKSPAHILICLSGSSAFSAILACLPPLLGGFDLVGSLFSFVTRIGAVVVSAWCLKVELGRQVEWEAETEQVAPLKEVWQAIGLIVIAVMVSRFVQGLLTMNEVGYREYGAQILLVVSPLVSLGVIALTKRYGRHSGYFPLIYWCLVMFSLTLLLVVSAAVDSSIGFLWVLLFAVYAQVDVAFMGVLSSLRKSFSSSFGTLVCLLFFGKDFIFACGRILRDSVDISMGSLICTIALLVIIVFEIIFFMIQTLRNTHSKDDPSSIPEALSSSIGTAYGLTPRECEVLLFLLQGRSYTNIATRLFISKSTVKTHANHLYAKLGVGTRDELIDLLESGLISEPKESV